MKYVRESIYQRSLKQALGYRESIELTDDFGIGRIIPQSKGSAAQ